MHINEKELRAIHAKACVAVSKVGPTLTPDLDAFWPIYLLAALSAAGLTCAETRAVTLEEAARICTARADMFAKAGSRTLQRAALNCAEAIRSIPEVQS
jgi:hypothetical protein